MNIGVRLKQLRKCQNMTQKKMAEMLLISERAYQHYESDTREPPLSNVAKIADYFGVSIDYLVGRTNNPEINK